MNGPYRALSVAAAVALLTSCAASQTAVTPFGGLRTITSWISHGTTSKDLLYVSNVDNEVTVYDYATDALVGVLTGFGLPMGLCTDRKGDVYVTDASSEDIVEYAHGGATPLQTLDDAPDHPRACSIDQRSGDLAVANDDGTSAQGNLAIWKAAKGTPTRYTDSAIFTVEGCAYDNLGNLLISGLAQGAYTDSFAWLPRGDTKFTNMVIPGPESKWNWYAVGVSWDGRFYTMDDYDIYRIAINHGEAYYAGSTTLTYQTDAGEQGPFAYYFQRGKATAAIAGVYNDTYVDDVNVWPYPAGGKTTATITHGIDRPFGVAVSAAKTL